MVWTVRMACDLENDCVALERILEYTKLTSEASWEPESDSRGPQRTRLMKSDFETHGWTPGCAGCEARKPGALHLGTHPPNHNETCRARMEKILSETNEGRLRTEEASARTTRRLVEMSGDICDNTSGGTNANTKTNN